MRTRRPEIARAVAGVGLLLTIAAAPARAHHAFAAEFDAAKPITLMGTVTKVEWINPHAWIHMDVKKSDGSTERWMVEGGPPNALLRRGFTKAALPPGAEVKVDGYQAKDGSKRANGRNLTLSDGRNLLMGSSGTGAPDDGREPTERK